jgi:hypothetical protein
VNESSFFILISFSVSGGFFAKDPGGLKTQSKNSKLDGLQSKT